MNEYFKSAAAGVDLLAPASAPAEDALDDLTRDLLDFEFAAVGDCPDEAAHARAPWSSFDDTGAAPTARSSWAAPVLVPPEPVRAPRAAAATNAARALNAPTAAASSVAKPRASVAADARPRGLRLVYLR
jgi:hypothetical protein